MESQTVGARTVAGVVEIIDNVVTNCEEILAVIRESATWQDALIGAGTEFVHNPEIRDNRTTSFDPFSFHTHEILYRFAKVVWTHVDDYAKRNSVSFSSMENVNINKYEPGQQYHVHADADRFMPRVISALVYLNDVEEGGETEFVRFNESITPRSGRLVIFPSNFAYAHAAFPPRSGVKYSAAFWFRQ